MLSRMCNFYPRPPRGGRLIYQATTEDDRKFLSTPSARRATWTATLRRSFTKFLSTPSARRATWTATLRRSFTKFLSTPSARRATSDSPASWQSCCISIHALREEGDLLEVSQWAM